MRLLDILNQGDLGLFSLGRCRCAVPRSCWAPPGCSSQVRIPRAGLGWELGPARGLQAGSSPLPNPSGALGAPGRRFYVGKRLNLEGKGVFVQRERRWKSHA